MTYYPNTDLPPLWVPLSGILLAIVLIVANSRACNSTITHAVRGLGAELLDMRWSYAFRHYRVQMRFPSGQIVAAACQCSPSEGVFWLNPPWLNPSQSPILPPVSKHCDGCGQPLQADWKCCPQCGKAAV